MRYLNMKEQYIINKKNEVLDLNGNYIGEYINNELIT